MFNKAKWITWADLKSILGPVPDTAENDFARLFRKEFTLKEKPTAATFRICGLGLYSAEINGKPVTDNVLTPPFSAYDKTVYYNEYDVTSFFNCGGNCICVTVGNGWYNYRTGSTWDFDKATWRHNTKLIVCLSVNYPDGSEEIITTDSSWQTNKAPILFNYTREGEDYDARLYIKGWNLFGFKGSGWENVFICQPPGGILKKDVYPPIRIIKTHQVKSITGNIYDFGVNMAGWVKITVKGEVGSEVLIRYAERLTKDGKLNQRDTVRFMGTERGHSCKYFLSGAAEGESWHPVFTYYGFRYAEITITGKAQVMQAQAHEVHTDLASIGSFECGDNMLNLIHAASVQATLSNFHGMPTDCPHREQNGWTGDALISCEQSLMNFDITPAYRKWLLDFKDVQRPSGQIPGIVPTSKWGYNWGSGPAWDSALVLIPLAIYELNGDISIAAEMWENMELYMEFMEDMAEDYITGFGLPDWCPPDNNKPGMHDIWTEWLNPNVPPVTYTDTAYYYADAAAMAKIASAIGNGRQEYYSNLAAKIKKAFRQKFIKDGEVIQNESQTAVACAIYQGLLEENEIPKAAAHLANLVRKNGNHIDCGILGTKYIFSALSENGYAQTAYEFTVNPEYPSYAHWINSGMTTLCETWEMHTSLNHHMYSEVDYWFYRHLAGIRPAKPGFQAVDIIPCFIDKIGWVKASHKGIEVYWDKEKLILSTPVHARVFIKDVCHEAAPGTHEFKR